MVKTMARARNIKPAIFKNEILGEEDPLLTILFIGLWALADKDGKLEDRPKRIKVEIFPYRDLPLFNGYLTQLQQLGFIERYEVCEVAVIKVINFRKHQSPHKTEKPSQLPDRAIDSGVTVKAPLKDDALTAALPPDSLIPDSLIPDSLEKKPPSPKGAIMFRTWLKNIGEENPIPESDPIFVWAASAGIPDNFLLIAWLEFKVGFESKDKKYKDWRAVFRDYVRKNYLKLWWISDVGYELTTAGRQAMNVLNAEQKRGAA